MGSLRALKQLRVVLSLFFLTATSVVLLDFRGILPPTLVRTILFLQFTPSVLRFLTLPALAATGFVLVLILTFLFGRVYCSTICPLGTVQDLVSYSSRKIRPKKFQEPTRSYLRIHLAFLLVSALPATFGSILALTLLDPFSNFGRLVQSLVRPMIIFGNNALSSLLAVVHQYDIFPVELHWVPVASILLPLLFLVLVGWMSFHHGRLYCNSMCPVGYLLRLLSRFSLLKISIDADHCKSCQLCQRVCKAGCIDRKAKSVDFERCVSCFNCFTACPSEGLRFVSRFGKSGQSEQPVDVPRRLFLLGSPALFLGQKIVADTSKVVKPLKESTIPERKHHPVTPPGSLSLAHFNQTCTACHVCISSCPSQVLQPSVLQYGLAGLLQPTMAFDASFCNFECTRCTEVCPSGAIARLSVEDKKFSQSGRVVFIRENCVVYTEETDCGACTEHCPTKAVTMIPYKNSRIPQVNADYCIGCGACEHACPVRPYRAIYVDGNSVHLRAKKKPAEKKQEVRIGDAFPF